MVRPELVSRVAQAGHDAEPIKGIRFRRATPEDLITAHLPFTTKTRFARKVANIKRHIKVYDKAFGERTAWHWRRWIALADREGIDAEFERSRFSEVELAALHQRGVVRSAAEILAGQRENIGKDPIPGERS
jgi:hypothetical protein